MATERVNPYGAFNFRIEFPNQGQGAFSEVSGIDSEQGVIEYRTGIEDTVMRRLPGIRKHPNLVLKRGIVGNTELWGWREKVMNGEMDEKWIVTVHLLDEKRQSPMVTWTLSYAWPVKWAGPALGASKNEIAIESLEIAYRTIKME